jgi:hypothetical protein
MQWQELDRLAQLKNVRSADRAVMRRLCKKLKRREPLTYQERLDAWAYIQRYGDRSAARR